MAMTDWSNVGYGGNLDNSWSSKLPKENRAAGKQAIQRFMDDIEKDLLIFSVRGKDLQDKNIPNLDFLIRAETLNCNDVSFAFELKADYYKGNNQFPIELFRYLPTSVTEAFRGLGRIEPDSEQYAKAQTDIENLQFSAGISQYYGLALADIKAVETEVKAKHYSILMKMPTKKAYIILTKRLQQYISNNLKALPLIPCHNANYDSLSVSIPCEHLATLADLVVDIEGEAKP